MDQIMCVIEQIYLGWLVVNGKRFEFWKSKLMFSCYAPLKSNLFWLTRYEKLSEVCYWQCRRVWVPEVFHWWCWNAWVVWRDKMTEFQRCTVGGVRAHERFGGILWETFRSELLVVLDCMSGSEGHNNKVSEVYTQGEHGRGLSLICKNQYFCHCWIIMSCMAVKFCTSKAFRP